MEPEMLDVQTEGEIKYSQEELEQIVAELQQINEETAGELQQAEGYVTTIYDNGNLDAGSQEVLVEVKEDIANQRKGLGESLTGLRDFLSGVKNRFEDAETKVKARLQGWLDRFKGGNKNPMDNPSGIIPDKKFDPAQSIKDYKEKSVEGLKNYNPMERINSYNQNKAELDKIYAKKILGEADVQRIQEIEHSMTPMERAAYYRIHQNFSNIPEDIRIGFKNTTDKVNSFFDRIKNR